MTDTMTPARFHAEVGVEDWRVLYVGPCAYFRTGSLTAGVVLVDAIVALAEAADGHPELDLRTRGVTVRLLAPDADGITGADVVLAQQISAAARELDAPADPGAVQVVEIAIDALGPEVWPFWRAVLAYERRGPVDLVDATGRGVSFRLQQMDAPRPQRNRLHVDISVPHDQGRARVDAAITAGGHLVSDRDAPSWWVLADPEGNEACVATWVGRD